MVTLNHEPSLSFQVIKKNSVAFLFVHIDSEVADLNRTVSSLEINSFLDKRLYLTISGFDSLDSYTDKQKVIKGSIILSIHDDQRNYEDQVILAEPNIVINPIKINKGEPVWPDVRDLKHYITNVWQNKFIDALDNYHEQVLNIFNPNLNSVSNLSPTESRAYTNHYQSLPQPIYSRKESGKTFQLSTGNRKLDYGIITSLIILLLSFAATNIYGTFFKNEQSTQNSISGEVVTQTPEEIKNQRLRELGIDPEQLNQDLGCFAE